MAEAADRWDLRPAGDRALVVRRKGGSDEEAAEEVRGLSAALAARRPAGVEEAVPGCRSLVVYYNPLRLPWPDLLDEVRQCIRVARSLPPPPGRVVEVPVLYGGEWGPDLAEVGRLAGLGAEEVAAMHSGGVYRVHFLGFVPGFAYMGPVPERLRVGRLASPRPAVPAGSVGIAGPLTGIYPVESPGGWRIIGRTPISVYDPHGAPRALLQAGDRVRFRAVDRGEYEELARRTAAAAAASAAAAPGTGAGARPVLAVREPGLLTTVQDLGRFGYQAEGVPVSGAADVQSLWVANRLVGNPPGEAGLEITLLGPVLEVLAEAVIAVTGADLGATLNGGELPLGVSVGVRPGDRLAFRGPRAGCRAYLAVAGGIAVPAWLGSKSTDLLGGMGGFAGRPLRRGDVIAAGPPGRPLRELVGRRMSAAAAVLPAGGGAGGAGWEVRAVVGPQDESFPAEAVALFFSSPYRVSPTSDRMGLRLEGAPVPPRPEAGELPSEGTPAGAVQVPPDGQPIVLMAGRQTMGGYHKIAVVIAPDLPLLAQARPGEAVRFRAVTLAEAHAAFARWVRLLESPELVQAP